MDQQRILEKLDGFLRKNDYSSAKSHLEYWHSEAESVGDNRSTLLLKNELMGLYRKIGEGDKAIGYAQSAIELIKKMNIEFNVGAATTYLNSATVFKAFGKAEESLSLFEKAKNIYEQNLSLNDERLGGLYNNMALAYVDLKKFDDADDLYMKAINIMQGIDNKETEQAITYLNMASAAEARYGLENAQNIISDCCEKAMELLDSGKNRSDGDYAFACEKCASVFDYYGYFIYYKELSERCRRIYEGS